MLLKFAPSACGGITSSLTPNLPRNTNLVAAEALRAGLPSANSTHSRRLECNAPMDCHAIFTLLQPPHLSQLQHLSEFRFNPGATPGSVPIRLPLLRIVDVRLSYDCEPFPTPAAATSAASSSAITSLHLQDYLLPQCALDTILHLPSALTHFLYAPVDRPDPGYSTYSVAALRETLQSLHVDLSGGWPGMMLSIIGTPRTYATGRLCARCGVRCRVCWEVTLR